MRKIEYTSSFTTGSTKPPAPRERNYGVIEVRVTTDAKHFTGWTMKLQEAMLELVNEHARLAGYDSGKVDRIPSIKEEHG